MTRKGNIIPNNVIESWPEIFGEVEFNFIPLQYLYAVLIHFKDNTVWEIKITASVRKNGWDSFETTIQEISQQYHQNITNIEFKIDTDRVIKDIKKKTQSFLKKRKLL